MSNFDPNYAAPRGVSTDRTAAEIDQGLRSYMLAVYNYMAIGVALTGVAAWLAFQLAGGDAIVVRSNQIGNRRRSARCSQPGGMIGGLILTFGLVMFISVRIDKLQPTTALALFLVYAALLGVMLSSILFTYTQTSIVRVFFISAASFGALSLYGYTTKRDLSAFGAFLVMGMIGLFIAMIVNMFWQNDMMAASSPSSAC
jgi:FtsH-binding integral membrane protein